MSILILPSQMRYCSEKFWSFSGNINFNDYAVSHIICVQWQVNVPHVLLSILDLLQNDGKMIQGSFCCHLFLCELTWLLKRFATTKDVQNVVFVPSAKQNFSASWNLPQMVLSKIATLTEVCKVLWSLLTYAALLVNFSESLIRFWKVWICKWWSDI